MTDLSKIIAAAQKKRGEPQSIKSQDSVLLLEQIQPREQDTRSLNATHVEALAESIAVLGLIEPLVIDIQGGLLAGGHRLAAIQLLKRNRPDKYQQHFPEERVPVRLLPLNAEQDRDLALQVEIAENEQRRDYTSSEVRALAERLRVAGFSDLKGRPKKGEKALMPALTVVVGKSIRTVQRYLNDTQEESTTLDTLLENEAKTATSKSTTLDTLFKQVLSKLDRWQKMNPKMSKEKVLSEKLPEFIQLIESVLSDHVGD